MKNFKNKNLLWIIFWCLYAFAGDYARSPVLDWLEISEINYRNNILGLSPFWVNYFINLLGLFPFLLMGIYNRFILSEKPLKSQAIRAFRINIFAMIYYMIIMMVIADRGFLIVPIYTAPIGMFMAGMTKHVKGFIPK